MDDVVDLPVFDEITVQKSLLAKVVKGGASDQAELNEAVEELRATLERGHPWPSLPSQDEILRGLLDRASEQGFAILDLEAQRDRVATLADKWAELAANPAADVSVNLRAAFARCADELRNALVFTGKSEKPND